MLLRHFYGCHVTPSRTMRGGDPAITQFAGKDLLEMTVFDPTMHSRPTWERGQNDTIFAHHTRSSNTMSPGGLMRSPLFKSIIL
ncbi:hypothetical protein D9Y22_22795 [Methylorubrum sp. DB1722]|nr:hypothetical protein [Methylorubrum sp. DB1722]